MTEDGAVQIPEFYGIDLTFRPRTYFWPLPLETHLLAQITGHERRKIIRAALAAGDNELPFHAATSTLESDARRDIGRIHPAFMGGEYLPKLNENEIEIARISLASTTADQISVRATRHKDAIAYRIVDEYSDVGSCYQCHYERSQLPLTLGDLVRMIDSAEEGGGAAMSALISNMEEEGDANGLRHFVQVSSEFYPELGSYYDRRITTWFDEYYEAKRLQELEEEEENEELGQRHALAVEPFAPSIAAIVDAWKSQCKPSGYAAGIGMLHRSGIFRRALEAFVIEHGMMPSGIFQVDRDEGMSAYTFDLDAIQQIIDEAGTDCA